MLVSGGARAGHGRPASVATSGMGGGRSAPPEIRAPMIGSRLLTVAESPGLSARAADNRSEKIGSIVLTIILNSVLSGWQAALALCYFSKTEDEAPMLQFFASISMALFTLQAVYQLISTFLNQLRTCTPQGDDATCRTLLKVLAEKAIINTAQAALVPLAMSGVEHFVSPVINDSHTFASNYLARLVFFVFVLDIFTLPVSVIGSTLYKRLTLLPALELLPGIRGALYNEREQTRLKRISFLTERYLGGEFFFNNVVSTLTIITGTLLYPREFFPKGTDIADSFAIGVSTLLLIMLIQNIKGVVAEKTGMSLLAISDFLRAILGAIYQGAGALCCMRTPTYVQVESVDTEIDVKAMTERAGAVTLTIVLGSVLSGWQAALALNYFSKTKDETAVLQFFALSSIAFFTLQAVHQLMDAFLSQFMACMPQTEDSLWRKFFKILTKETMIITAQAALVPLALSGIERFVSPVVDTDSKFLSNYLGRLSFFIFVLHLFKLPTSVMSALFHKRLTLIGFPVTNYFGSEVFFKNLVSTLATIAGTVVYPRKLFPDGTDVADSFAMGLSALLLVSLIQDIGGSIAKKFGKLLLALGAIIVAIPIGTYRVGAALCFGRAPADEEEGADVPTGQTASDLGSTVVQRLEWVP